MNKTECDYSDYLEIRRCGKEILKWEYQSLTFRWAEDVRYTPDFTIYVPVGPGIVRLEAHETKGYMRDDARVKVQTAASLFPWLRFFVVRSPAHSAGPLRAWQFEAIKVSELTPVPALRAPALTMKTDAYVGTRLRWMGDHQHGQEHARGRLRREAGSGPDAERSEGADQ